jgi:hypothetical protein
MTTSETSIVVSAILDARAAMANPTPRLVYIARQTTEIALQLLKNPSQ